MTPLTRLGTLRRLARGWEALIRIDDHGKRRGFALTAIAPDDELAARERCNAMALLALRIRRAGHADALPKLLQMAARARAGKAWDAILAAGDRLCSGTTEPISEAARVTVAELGVQWRSGALHQRLPDHVKPKDSQRDGEIARIYVDPVIGDRRIADLTLDDAEEVMAEIVRRHAAGFRAKCDRARKKPRADGERRPVATPPAPATRRHVAQYLRRLLGLSVYPCRIRLDSPIPKGWLPRLKDAKAKECLYPDEDRALLACAALPLVRRLAYGFLTREGMRTNELARLEWRDVDLPRGRVDLDENKTDDPRSWDLDPGVCRALAVWRDRFCAEAGERDRVFLREGVVFSLASLAAQLRADLKRAGVTRSKLFERSATRQPIRAHDLRATFITASLAVGHTETWVSDRTGHTSSVMINRYRRRARTWKLGVLDPLDIAIPELASLIPDTPAEAPSTAPAWLTEPRVDHERILPVATWVLPWEAEITSQRSHTFHGMEASPEIGFKIRRMKVREGSSPSFGTTGENRSESPAPATTADSTDQGRDPLAIFSSPGDALEPALARALEAAAAAGRFDVVAQLARELEARRLAAAPNVVPIAGLRRPGSRS